MNDLLPTDFIETIIPIISADVVFNKFDERNYLVQNQENKFNIKVSTKTYELLQLVDGQRSIREITDLMNENGEYLLTSMNVYTVLHDHLSIYGIIKGFPEEIEVKERVVGIEYLSIRISLLSKDRLSFFTKIISPIFHPKFFYWVIIIGIIWVSFILSFFRIEYSLSKSVDPSSIAYFYLLYLLGCILHELGHASACHYFGAKHGGIGFGFYLFSPVFYADVSDAWKLNSFKRVIIDLGGIFMQIIFITLLSIIFLITNNFFWMNAMIIILISIIPNVNPFLRYDGYWTLSDYMNIPNLRKHSNKVLMNTIEWIYGIHTFPLKDTRSIFLMLYALISNIFIAIFLVSILLHNPKSIIYFPVNFYNFLLSIWRSVPNFYSIYDLIRFKSSSFIIPLIFYFIVIKMISQKGKEYYRSILSRNL